MLMMKGNALQRKGMQQGLTCSISRHGVDVFVLDSGVHVEHPDFEGRAFTSSNFVQEEEDTDFAGHGMLFTFIT